MFSRILTVHNRRDNCFYWIGLSIIQGAYKLQKVDLSKPYDFKQLAHFRITISRDRYQLLIKFCLFDDIEIRNQKKKNKNKNKNKKKKFVTIQKLWDMFVTRSMDLYNIGEYGAVDGMLLKFYGRCGFHQYMPSKPGC